MRARFYKDFKRTRRTIQVIDEHGQSHWLTPSEATALRNQLNKAIRQAREGK